MGRKTARRTRASGRPSRPSRTIAASRGAGRAAAAWLGALALILGAGAWWLLTRDRSSPAAARHPAEFMSAAEAEAVGASLARVGRHEASLPYYRRVVDQYGTAWMAHANYSSALHNAAQESRLHLGRLGPAARSSAERIALMAISLHEGDLAEHGATSRQERALALFQRGQTLQTWGFPVDALAEYRRALELSSEDPTLRLVTNKLTSLLSNGGAD